MKFINKGRRMTTTAFYVSIADRSLENTMRMVTFIKPTLDAKIEEFETVESKGIEAIRSSLENEETALDLFAFDQLPRWLYCVGIIQAYASVENSLNLICESALREGIGVDIRLNDLKGSGINRAKLYLNYSGFHFPTGSSSWDKLKRIQKIRNSLIHNDFSITEENTDKKDYDNFLRWFPQLDVNPLFGIIVTYDFLCYAIEDMRSFFREFAEVNDDLMIYKE